MIDKYLYDSKIVLFIGDTYYALNENNRNKLINMIDEDLIQQISMNTSDGRTFIALKNAESITLINVKNKHKYNFAGGKFFKYTHNLDLDLTLYGIYKNEDAQNIEYIDSCFINSLKVGGMCERKLNNIRLMCKNAEVPMSKINEICEKIDIKVILKRPENKGHVKPVYGVGEEIYNIGLIDGHYFLINETNITKFALTNYDTLKDIKNFNHIVNSKNKKDKRYVMNSYDLILNLFDNKEKYLTKLTAENSNTAMSQYYKHIEDDIKSLEFNESNLKKVETKEPKERAEYVNIFADFETETYNNEKQHTPYLCCYISQDGRTGSFYGKQCGLEMMRDLEKHYKNIRIIAHNASYDYRFLANILFIKNEINKGSKVMTSEGKFFKMNVIIKDSYALIPLPLKKFAETFELEDKKEILPYDLYNNTNAVNDKFVDIVDALKYINKNDHADFIENINKWDLKQGDKFDCVKYSQIYCKYDCLVLKNGYNIFKQWMDKLAGLDIDNILTIASLAHRYFIKEGCYDDVYELSGVVQQFIQKCVVGGRTMCADNKMIVKHGLHIQDFDAVSLYPSAMSRLDGFLKGKPKIIQDLNYDNIKNFSGYFLEIKIKKVGVERKFSTMSSVNEKGVRIFSNDMIDKSLYIDKIALEDLIEFQKVEFEVIRGYYFNEGFNPKIKEVITNVFKQRKLLKSQNNPSETAFKLIMNSGYGKSIMKPVDIETKIFNNQKDFDIFLSRNYTWIQEYNKFEDKIRCKVIKPINEHFNIAQVGVSILSMSKRIMNEVMCLAEDNKLEIFYQDTDSMHIQDKDIKLLSSLYEDKYKRVLIGSNMGQFHSDFELVDYKYKNDKGYTKKKNCENITAVKSIFLGKKSYIDELQGTTKDGKIKTDYHIRLKGIPASCIDYTYKNIKTTNPHLNIDKLNTPFELYELLSDHKKIYFDLTENGNKLNCKFNKNGTITTIKNGLFTRGLQF